MVRTARTNAHLSPSARVLAAIAPHIGVQATGLKAADGPEPDRGKGTTPGRNLPPRAARMPLDRPPVRSRPGGSAAGTCDDHVFGLYCFDSTARAAAEVASELKIDVESMTSECRSIPEMSRPM